MPIQFGRHEHHVLASLIASRQKEGIIVSDEECSAICGWAPGTIGGLRQQAGFRKLIQHYLGDQPIAQPVPAERIAALGLTTLEELQARLHEDPDSFSKRELMDMAELLLIKARSLGGGAGPVASGGSGIRVAINFVEARPRELAPPPAEAVIDVTPIYNESATADSVTSPSATSDNSATTHLPATTDRRPTATSQGKTATAIDEAATRSAASATRQGSQWPENATSPPIATRATDPGNPCAAPAAKPKRSNKRRARASDPRLGMPPWPQPAPNS